VKEFYESLTLYEKAKKDFEPISSAEVITNQFQSFQYVETSSLEEEEKEKEPQNNSDVKIITLK
jgi:hypothetical protein